MNPLENFLGKVILDICKENNITFEEAIKIAKVDGMKGTIEFDLTKIKK